MNVWTSDELSYGRIAPSVGVSSDLDFKFQEGNSFVAIHKLVHYHSRIVLGDHLVGLDAATKAESLRAQATESSGLTIGG